MPEYAPDRFPLRRRDVLALWAFSRVLVLFLAGPHGSDIPFYAQIAAWILDGQVPYRDFPLDHPPLVLAVVTLPAIAAGVAGYAAAFRTMMLGVDFVSLLLVGNVAARAGATPAIQRRAEALYVWLGALAYPALLDSFDLLVAALALTLVRWGAMGRFARGYGALVAALGLNAGTFWLWPFWLIADLRSSRRPLGALLRFGAGLVVALAATWGAARAWGPGVAGFLRYHWSGAAEVESLPATFLAVVRAVTGESFSVDPATGVLRLAAPGAESVGRVAVSLAAAVMAVAWLRASRRGPPCTGGPEGESRWLLSGTLLHLLAFQLSCGVLLPQYLLWVAPVACAALPAVREPRLWAATWVAVIVYTVAGLPLNAASLLRPWSLPFAAVVLRNFLLLAAAAWSLRSWQRARAEGGPSALPAAALS
jgi:hypothetical protein